MVIESSSWYVTKFFRLQLCYMLDIVPSCNFVQYQGKLMNQLVAKSLISVPILACLAQIWGLNFFSWVLPLLVVRHCSELWSYALSRKLINQTWEHGKKNKFWAWFWPVWPKFGLSNFFLWFLPLLVARLCSKLSSYAI